ncbi:MAG: acyltransferase family protein [Proteobacteria bacterium]|nr:acyltransferase family protein [Pseudomonadota bacterium]
MGETKTRAVWVDAVRGVGILLMFYGHVLQKAFSPDNAAAADQLRLIYSFHMPLFFVMSGFFFKPSPDLLGRLRQLVVRRLVPVAFFGLLLLPIWARDESRAHLPLWHDTLQMGADYLRGRPELNWVTWFLVCLFVCELLAAVILPRLTSTWARVLFGVTSVLAGVFFCDHSLTSSTGFAYGLGRTWFLSEAIVALGFFAIGHALYPYARKLAEHRRRAGVIFVVGAAVVLGTFRLNQTAGPAVMMAARQHGDALEFLFTALAGSVAIIALGVLLTRWQGLQVLGRNTLPLLGLNGLFFHYIDPKLAHIWQIPNSPGLVLLDTLFVTALSLVVCAPAVYLMNRYVPQLIGKSGQKGPLLPALERTPS